MTRLRSVQPTDFHGRLRSRGHLSSMLTVQAFCTCGWTGPSRSWEAGAQALEESDLAEHLAESGHSDGRLSSFLDGDVDMGEGLHDACGHVHHFNDVCPTPPDSPRGRLDRSMLASVSDPVEALDRLVAIAELRDWLGDQEKEAVIGARMARATWTEMGEAVGISKQGAFNRWGTTIKRYEATGLLDPAADVVDGYLADGWTIDEKGRWHKPLAGPGDSSD